MFKNKKGMDPMMIILLILAIAVGIMFLLWATGTFRLGGGVSNAAIDTSISTIITENCNYACSTSNVNDFCKVNRTIEYKGRTEVEIEGKKEVVKSISGSCNEMATKPKMFPGITIAPCNLC
jgi:hypothetical protein